MVVPTGRLEELAAELRDQIEGEVRFDTATRLLYSTDASLYQIMPLGVVVPRHAGDVVTAVTLAARYNVPVLPRGSGTSLGGQTVGEALVIDGSKHLNRVLEIDADGARARVQPGVILDELNAQLRPHRLQFAPDVATSDRASVGGMMGNNSSGAHSVIYGKTVDHVLAQQVVLADGSETEFRELDAGEWARREDGAGTEGRIYRTVRRVVDENADEIDRRFPHIMRRVGGYNLDEFARRGSRNLAKIAVGSEGTLVFVTEATLNLVPTPAAKALLVAQFADLIEALEATPACLEHHPAAVELTDRTILALSRGNPALAHAASFLRGDPESMLAVEFYGDSEREVADRVAGLASDLERRGFGYAWVPVVSPAQQRDVWNLRKAGLGLLMGMKGDDKPVGFVEDTAVPPERLADYIRRFRDVLTEHGCQASYYAHASVGCLHVRPLLNLKRGGDVARMRSIAQAVASLVLEYGGAMSAEHGDGLVRSEFQAQMFGERLYTAFQEVKAAFDPEWRMNPGKIVRAPRMDENLRYGERYQTLQIETHFDFERDGGFARSVELCSGVGACRKKLTGVMCPSYRATMEEEHSTRGRANLLRAALSGRLPGGMADESVHHALDLCLECKACKSECPSNVDMAKMKAEFLAHHHAAHGTPPRARFFAHVAQSSSRAAAVAPLATWLSRTPAARWVLETALGIDRRRPLPAFARCSFHRWWRARENGRKGAPEQLSIDNCQLTIVNSGTGVRNPRKVVLFVDTFTNYNEPENGMAAVRVLEAFGYRVDVPQLPCCGRPMISKGLLDDAKANARAVVERLAPLARERVPILGLEPSCLSCLRDDYVDLLGSEDARAVAAQTWLVEQFLGQRHGAEGAGESGLPLRTMPARALLHGHCHQKAVFGTAGALAGLRLVPGLEVEEIPAGCCGMAGSFGYEKEHYDLSLKIGELGLLPQVRAAPPETLILAAGTSCRQQIAHATGRQAIHPIFALARSLDAGSPVPELPAETAAARG